MFNNYFERVFRNTDVTRYSTTSLDTTFNSNENFFFYDLSANLLVEINRKNKLKFNFIHFFNDLQYQEDLNFSGTDDSKTSSLRQPKYGRERRIPAVVESPVGFQSATKCILLSAEWR
jgi:hypothetical protein